MAQRGHIGDAGSEYIGGRLIAVFDRPICTSAKRLRRRGHSLWSASAGGARRTSVYGSGSEAQSTFRSSHIPSPDIQKHSSTSGNVCAETGPQILIWTEYSRMVPAGRQHFQLSPAFVNRTCSVSSFAPGTLFCLRSTAHVRRRALDIGPAARLYMSEGVRRTLARWHGGTFLCV